MQTLKQLDLDLYQICVITPLPETALWTYLDENYGIFEKDYAKYDTKHLVWNHPNFTQQEMKQIHNECVKKLYSPNKFIKSMIKNSKKLTRHNLWKGLKYQIKSAISANFSYYIKKEHKLIKEYQNEK